MAAAGAIGKSIGATEASANPEEENKLFYLALFRKTYFA